MKIRVLLLFMLLSHSLWAQNERAGNWITCGQDSAISNSANRVVSSGTSQSFSSGQFYATAINMPDAAGKTILKALSIWNNHINTSIPIKIQIEWTAISGTSLAQTRPTMYYKNFSNQVASATWYPVALAEKIAQRELNDSDDYEMEITINQNANLILDYEEEIPNGKYDLLTIILHEIAHGLGFLSIAEKSDDGIILSDDNCFTVYDLLLIDQKNNRLYLQNNDPESLAELTTSNAIFLFTLHPGDHAMQCYAPGTFLDGISISHLDVTNEQDSSLMIPYIPSGWQMQYIDEATMNIINNMGWDSEEALRIKTFPNPASKLIYFSIPSAIDELQVDIINLSGQKVLSRNIYNNSYSDIFVDISNLNNGIYIFTIHNNRLILHTAYRILINR